jgi:hypothetical protein
MTRLALIAFAALALVGGDARAADPRHPDWPCNQIKVPELSLVSVWAGPAIDDVGNAWQSDPQVSSLVGRLAARRTSIEEAEKAIAEFLSGDAALREKRAKLLMAGLFATLNAERGQVMNGIERFSRRQKDFAEKIRAETREIRALQDAPDPDEAKIEELANVINWDTRIFEEQRRTIGYVCDVPVTIERRLGALARAIQQALD